MPFGKYKGDQIEDIPSPYLQWALENLDLDEALIEEMENQLRARRGEGIVRVRGKE